MVISSLVTYKNKKSYFYTVFKYSLGISILSILVTSFILGIHIQKIVKQSLSDSLLSIVRTASSGIDGNSHQEIFGIQDKILTPNEFNKIRHYLINIKNNNHLSSKYGSPIYTFRKSNDFHTK